MTDRCVRRVYVNRKNNNSFERRVAAPVNSPSRLTILGIGGDEIPRFFVRVA